MTKSGIPDRTDGRDTSGSRDLWATLEPTGQAAAAFAHRQGWRWLTLLPGHTAAAGSGGLGENPAPSLYSAALPGRKQLGVGGNQGAQRRLLRPS